LISSGSSCQKKQVHPNLNELFADVEAIKRAIDKAATKDAAKAAKISSKKSSSCQNPSSTHEL
jgi:carbamoylphosphate synthase large subunit